MCNKITLHNGVNAMIYGLDPNKDQWLLKQMTPLVEISPQSIDGLSIELKGVNSESFKPLVELHGILTSDQLRMLADALENTPN